MIIELTLNEMFAISRIVEKQSVIGYRAALTKLFHKMLDIPEFSKLVVFYEEIKANEITVLKEFESQRSELSKQIQKEQIKDSIKLPEDLQSKCDAINAKILQRIQEINKTVISQVNKILEKELISSFQFDELLIKSISSIVELEKTIEELGIEEAVVKYIISVYVKIEEQKK